jgi:hypothetical protein
MVVWVSAEIRLSAKGKSGDLVAIERAYIEVIRSYVQKPGTSGSCL